MKRRSFMKKSVAAAIVAATPLALTGLVNAAGGSGSGTETGTQTGTTGFFETTLSDLTTASACQFAIPNSSRWIYVGGACYKIYKVDPNDPHLPPVNPPPNPECVAGKVVCATGVSVGETSDMPDCQQLKRGYVDDDGNDLLGPGYLGAMFCNSAELPPVA